MVHIKVTSSSAMAERPRATHASCTVTFRANSYGPLDGRMVILQICRWKFSHVLLKLNFIQKTKNRFLSNPLGTSRLRTLSIYSSLESPWSTYYIHRNWTFSLSLTVEGNLKRKSVEVGVFRRGGSLWAQISDGRGHRPPTTVGIRKLE